MSAPSHRIAAILASHVTHAADSCPEGEVEESAIIDVAFALAYEDLVEAFGTEAADRICADERTHMLCDALLRWHWSTGGAL